MLIVSRTCTSQQERDGLNSRQVPKSIALQDLRDVHAFVLLGDPGAGKSASFKEEAKALGTVPISARNFVTFKQDPETWVGKTIFIDGLDETRAGGGDGRDILDAIRRKLDQLGHPRFRISCRAADWLGESNNRRRRTSTFLIGDNDRLAAFHNSNN